MSLDLAGIRERLKLSLGIGGSMTDYERDVAALLAEVDRLKTEAGSDNSVLGWLDSFDAEIEVSAARRETGGQQCGTPRGEFRGAPPSVYARLRWWSREIRRAACRIDIGTP